MRRQKKKLFLGMVMVLSVGLLVGCSSKKNEEKYIPVSSDEYDKKVYNSVQVKAGTLSPMIKLVLKPEGYEVISYNLSKDDLVVDELNVEIGSKVTAGESMVTFKNDGLAEKIKGYMNQLSEDQLIIDHYEKLAEIDTENDYTDIIEEIKEDMLVTNAYLNETNAKFNDYQIVSEKSGVVTGIADCLYKGYGQKGITLVKVASGSSNYTTSTSEDYEFNIGDEFEATAGVASYKLKLINIEEKDNKKDLTFEPITDMSTVSETAELKMEIAKTPIENAVYVEKEAINEINQATYVFKIDENGYRHAVQVDVLYVIDEYAIISGDIEVGEWVTI